MITSNAIHDVAVVGAGAAGCMAAIRAGSLKRPVILIERNESIGRKILLTGNGRCNLTNQAPLEAFLRKFKPNPEFYRTAFFKFFSNDLEEFFRAKGLELKVEDRGRVLPQTGKASSVNAVLEDYLKENNILTVFNRRVVDITRFSDFFSLACQNGDCYKTKNVIISTGGVTYQATGSTGDGLTLAKRLGHTITGLNPGLVPLEVKEDFIKELQGLSFDKVRIEFLREGKKNISPTGEIIFTHFGLSGPLVLDISGDIAPMFAGCGEVKIGIDFCPGLGEEELKNYFVKKISPGRGQAKGLLDDFLPKRMAPVFLSSLNIEPQKLASQLSRKERLAIITNLKKFSLTVTGTLPFDEAMVTCGGVSMKEINPRTMESKLVKGLYFAGEIIEAAGESGGYNLQQAFSTGYLAGSLY